MKKKKISELTEEEVANICEKYIKDFCLSCPLAVFVGGYNEKVACYKELSEKEVEVDENID